ncbi:MAG: CPBP family intramembrane glutamic endopeptidase [Planctomycetota bacterium]|jgi:membrane protease YdiL (CAAX protease family)
MRLKQLFAEADRTVLLVLTSSAVLLAAYMTYGSNHFAAGVLGTPARDQTAVVWMFLAALLLLGLAPALLWRTAVRAPLGEIGLTLGDARFGLKITGIATVVVILPLMYVASRLGEVQDAYPMAEGVGDSTKVFLLYEIAYLLYYLGWETFFRGYLTLGLAGRIGPFPAVALSTLVSTAIHYGKPVAEVWGAVVAGFLFGWLAIRTRSVVWPLVVHAAVGVLNDLFIVLAPLSG